MRSTTKQATSNMCFIFATLLLCALCSCASVKRPDTVLYGVNTKSQTLRGYNLKDYDDEGNRKTNATVVTRPLSDLKDGWICTDPKGLANLKVYLGDLREEAKDRCK